MADLWRKYGMREVAYYNWKAKFAGMTVSDVKRLKALEEENRRLKQNSGGAGPGQQGAQGSAGKKLLGPKAKRLAVSYSAESLGKGGCHMQLQVPLFRDRGNGTTAGAHGGRDRCCPRDRTSRQKATAANDLAYAYRSRNERVRSPRIP